MLVPALTNFEDHLYKQFLKHLIHNHFLPRAKTINPTIRCFSPPCFYGVCLTRPTSIGISRHGHYTAMVFCFHHTSCPP